MGRFLLNTDKNIRYVALNTLLKVVHADMGSIQRHRGTIVECLKDPDVSLKRRAMELCFALINRTNIIEMTDELMVFLGTCEPEFKADCSSNMFISMEKYAPNRNWHVDQMTRVLKTAGNHIRDDIVSSFITLISNMPDFQFYTMNHLVKLIKDDVTQQPLVQVAVWCLGEYGDQYLNLDHTNEDKISEQEIVNILIKVLNYNAGLIATRQYAINALGKLTTRFPDHKDQIKSVMSIYGCNMNLELQQRAVEYNSILKRYENLRDGLFEQMPPIELKTNNYPINESYDETNNDENNVNNNNDDEIKKQKEEAAKNLLDIFGEETSTTTAVSSTNNTTNNNNLDILDMLSDPVQSTSNNMDSLFSVKNIPNQNNVNNTKQNSNQLDIMDIFGGSNTNAVVNNTSNSNTNNVSNNLLDDIFGGGINTTTTTTPSINTTSKNDILDLFGTPSSTNTINSTTTTTNGLDSLFSNTKTPTINNNINNDLVAYEKNDVKIVFEPAANGRHSNAEQHFIQMKAHNLSLTNNVKEFLFSAAAPKTMQLQLSQPNTNVILPLDTITQTLAISNPKRVRFI